MIISNIYDIIKYLNEKIGGEFDSEEIEGFACTILMSTEGRLKLCVGGVLDWTWDSESVVNINFIQVEA